MEIDINKKHQGVDTDAKLLNALNYVIDGESLDPCDFGPCVQEVLYTVESALEIAKEGNDLYQKPALQNISDFAASVPLNKISNMQRYVAEGVASMSISPPDAAAPQKSPNPEPPTTVDIHEYVLQVHPGEPVSSVVGKLLPWVYCAQNRLVRPKDVRTALAIVQSLIDYEQKSPELFALRIDGTLYYGNTPLSATPFFDNFGIDGSDQPFSADRASLVLAEQALRPLRIIHSAIPKLEDRDLYAKQLESVTSPVKVETFNPDSAPQTFSDIE